MKLISLVTTSLLFIVLLEARRVKRPRNLAIIRVTVLQPDEPIQHNKNKTVITRVAIDSSNGSIGNQTFSSLPEMNDLTIERSNISHIEDGVLCLAKVRNLRIIYNEEFPVLTKSLFSNCIRLESLLLTDVQLEHDVFKEMMNLEDLHLERLKGFRLSKDFLEPLENLKSLEFVDVEFERIDSGVICLSPKMETVYLSGNKYLPPLTRSTFDNCNNVKELTIRDNQDVHIDEGIFGEFVNIKKVTLKNLIIPHLTKRNLAGLENAEHLEITFSHVSDIDDDAFAGFKNLELLNLGTNELTKADFAVGLNRLRFLNLEYNKLTEIDAEVLSHFPDLRRLELQWNKLVTIDSITHPNIKELNVEGNNISQIDAAAVKRNLPMLEDLTINYNPISSEHENYLRKTFEEIQFHSYISESVDD